MGAITIRKTFQITMTLNCSCGSKAAGEFMLKDIMNNFKKLTEEVYQNIKVQINKI